MAWFEGWDGGGVEEAGLGGFVSGGIYLDGSFPGMVGIGVLIVIRTSLRLHQVRYRISNCNGCLVA